MSARRVFLALKNLLAVILPGLAASLLLAHAYLGASKGYPLFTFLLNTTLGNVLLAVAASLCAYHVLAALIGISDTISVAERAHSVLLILVLSLITYPFAATLTEGFIRLALALLLSAVSALPMVINRAPRVIEILCFVTLASFIAVALLDDRIADSFNELCRSIAELEQLLKGLGLS